MVSQQRTVMANGFPAGSLPHLRFLPYVVAKSMIARGFSVWGKSRKIFYPGFPCAAGNRRGGGTCFHPFLGPRQPLARQPRPDHAALCGGWVKSFRDFLCG